VVAAQPSRTKSVFFGRLGALFHPGAFLHPSNILALKTAQATNILNILVSQNAVVRNIKRPQNSHPFMFGGVKHLY
jgi:hypothetical protein